MKSGQSLSLEAAFVVQVRSGATSPSGMSGRIEHVVSGRACCFASTAELLSFIEQTLQAFSLHPPAR